MGPLGVLVQALACVRDQRDVEDKRWRRVGGVLFSIDAERESFQSERGDGIDGRSRAGGTFGKTARVGGGVGGMLRENTVNFWLRSPHLTWDESSGSKQWPLAATE